MADLDQLKAKYQSVLDLIPQRNVRLDHLHVQDDKLFMQGAAPNQDVKNEIWNAIKAVDESYSDLTCDLSIDSTLPAPAPPPDAPSADAAPSAESYTVQPGDSLSKIAKRFYGDAGQYMRIFEANQDQLQDPNKIQIGQELKIPPAA